jgi:hypothetical protein
VRAALKTCLLVGLVAQPASVVIISYGVHLRTHSARFEEHEKAVWDRIIAEDRGKDYGPGIGLGMALASSWLFVGCIMLFPLFTIIFALFAIHSLVQWNRTAALVGSGALAVACCLVAFGQPRSALTSFDWGFIVLGAGELFHAVGLVLAAIGAPYVALRIRDSHLRPSCSSVV